jgi:hypothetical protein
MWYERWSHTLSLKNITLQMFSVFWVIRFVNQLQKFNLFNNNLHLSVAVQLMLFRKQLQFILDSFKSQTVAESNLLGQLHECFFYGFFLGGGGCCVYLAVGGQKCHLTFPEIKEI